APLHAVLHGAHALPPSASTCKALVSAEDQRGAADLRCPSRRIAHQSHGMVAHACHGENTERIIAPWEKLCRVMRDRLHPAWPGRHSEYSWDVQSLFGS